MSNLLLRDRLDLTLEFGVKGKARPRFNRSSGVAYMPTDFTVNKSTIAWALKLALFGRVDFFSPTDTFVIRVVTYRKRPKPKSKKDMARLLLECGDGEFAQGKPDIDNLSGTIMDAAVGVVYRDDSQVSACYADRRWGEVTRSYVRIIKLRTPTGERGLDGDDLMRELLLGSHESSCRAVVATMPDSTQD